VIEPILDARALALWVDHTLDKRSVSPIELTILAKPPAALMRRAKPALRISREDPALIQMSRPCATSACSACRTAASTASPAPSGKGPLGDQFENKPRYEFNDRSTWR
jgi:hypothetical protein